MLPGSSPSHENLAAELLPIEYRLITLSLICSSLAVCVNTDFFYLWGLFREKFIRLQHENKMLRVQQEESEREKIAALQTQLEEAHKAQSELDTENRSEQLICVLLSLRMFSSRWFQSTILHLFTAANLQTKTRAGR